MKSLMAVSVLGANDVPDRYAPAAELDCWDAEEPLVEELPDVGLLAEEALAAPLAAPPLDDAGAEQPMAKTAHAKTSSAARNVRLSARINSSFSRV